jgi:hypothetical protein
MGLWRATAISFESLGGRSTPPVAWIHAQTGAPFEPATAPEAIKVQLVMLHPGPGSTRSSRLRARPHSRLRVVAWRPFHVFNGCSHPGCLPLLARTYHLLNLHAIWLAACLCQFPSFDPLDPRCGTNSPPRSLPNRFHPDAPSIQPFSYSASHSRACSSTTTTTALPVRFNLSTTPIS